MASLPGSELAKALMLAVGICDFALIVVPGTFNVLVSCLSLFCGGD